MVTPDAGTGNSVDQAIVRRLTNTERSDYFDEGAQITENGGELTMNFKSRNAPMTLVGGATPTIFRKSGSSHAGQSVTFDVVKYFDVRDREAYLDKLAKLCVELPDQEGSMGRLVKEEHLRAEKV